MKNPDINDLLLILVSAGWAKRDIVALLMQASKLNSFDLEDELSEISYKFEEIRRYSSIKERHRKPLFLSSAKKNVSDDGSDLYLKIRDMLVLELGLSNQQIVSLLSEKLGGDAQLPSLSKKSLANWLERLSFHHSPSEILHAATVIREKFNKERPLDWGVRGES